MELEEFDALCKELGEKTAQLKKLETEVKDMRKKVLDVLLTRDEDDQRYVGGGYTFYVRNDLYPKLPQDLNDKRATLVYLRSQFPNWYIDKLTFNSRAFKSFCDAERTKAAEKGEEWDGIPNVEMSLTQGLGMRKA